MKKAKIILGTLILGSLIFITGCKKDDNSSGGSSNPNVSGNITSGSWRVSRFIESGDDHTADLSGYVFVFSSGGQLTATISGVRTDGTWSSDDSSHKLKLNIGTTQPLSKLSDDWIVVMNSQTQIQLNDDNPARTDELHFIHN